jgi:hypothetical protein
MNSGFWSFSLFENNFIYNAFYSDFYKSTLIILLESIGCFDLKRKIANIYVFKGNFFFIINNFY